MRCVRDISTKISSIGALDSGFLPNNAGFGVLRAFSEPASSDIGVHLRAGVADNGFKVDILESYKSLVVRRYTENKSLIWNLGCMMKRVAWTELRFLETEGSGNRTTSILCTLRTCRWNLNLNPNYLVWHHSLSIPLMSPHYSGWVHSAKSTDMGCSIPLVSSRSRAQTNIDNKWALVAVTLN